MLASSASLVDNAAIVKLIGDNDPRGGELLYESYRRGLTFLANRHCPEHAEDCVQETLMTALQQIRAGALEQAGALPGYLSIILKRTAWAKRSATAQRESTGSAFETVVNTHADERAHPERVYQIEEQSRLLKKGLGQLTAQQREILTRFYLQAQKPEEICLAMRLSATQFRLLKSRSKQKLQSTIEKASKKPLANFGAVSAAAVA